LAKSSSDKNIENKKNWKTVVIVFLFVASPYLIPVLITYISKFIGTAYNPTNPNIYRYNNEIICDD
jgi:cytochrome c biogenesis protein CcdA